MGNVEGELVVDAFVFRADLDGAVDIDDQVAAPGIVFTGDGVVAEADDIGGAVLGKVFAVGLRDAVVINQNDADFAPLFGSGDGFEFFSQPITQPLQFPSLNWMVFLLVLETCFHCSWGRGYGRAACLKARR